MQPSKGPCRICTRPVLDHAKNQHHLEPYRRLHERIYKTISHKKAPCTELSSRFTKFRAVSLRDLKRVKEIPGCCRGLQGFAITAFFRVVEEFILLFKGFHNGFERVLADRGLRLRVQGRVQGRGSVEENISMWQTVLRCSFYRTHCRGMHFERDLKCLEIVFP